MSRVFLYLLFFSLLISNPLFSSEELNNDNQKSQNITLNSDSFDLDGKTGIFKHCGNATLTQLGLSIVANCLTGKKLKDGNYEFIVAQGNPAQLTQTSQVKNETLNVSANIIEYIIPNQQFNIIENAALKIVSDKRDSIEITANKIQLDNKSPENRDITATGKPLRIELLELGKTDLKAEAKKLHFNTQNSDLELSDDVVAHLELGQISAGIFKYNSKTKISSFKKSDDQQVEIIQKKKEQK